MRILLAEDEADLADAIRRVMARDGHAVDWAADGQQVLALLSCESYDLVVLDIGLPHKDGLQVLAELRRKANKTPVLMLTARAAVEDRVRALDVGADDYLAKPFDFREFAARCRALLRRPQGLASGVTRIGDLQFNRATHHLSIREHEIELPNREFQLLEILIGRLNRVVSKDEIARHVFSLEEDAGHSTIEIHMSRLRKKLVGGPLTIRTLRGSGYVAETTAPVSDDG